MITIGQPRYPLFVSHQVNAVLDHVEIEFGQRLSSMSLDSSRIVSRDDGIYTAGEIVIGIDTGVWIKATRTDQPGQIQLIEHQPSRALLLKHGVGLMRSALGVNDGLLIEVRIERHLPHCGLGTSSLLVAIAAIAMNEIYGRPVADGDLARYLAQNHGEEVANSDEHLLPVQCLGGSGAVNLYTGALQVLTGETTVVAAMNVPNSYKAVIAVPIDRSPSQLDASALMKAENANAAGFTSTGLNHRMQIAYDLLHEGLPEMLRGDFTSIGRIVFDHRFNWGSIRNCSFSHPRLLDIAAGVRHLWEDGVAPILGLSSAGPAFYAITESVDECEQAFASHGLETFSVPLFNDRYRILSQRARKLALRDPLKAVIA